MRRPFLWLLSILLVDGSLSVACPLCPPSRTLSRDIADCAAVVIAEWDSGKPGGENEPGDTTFRIRRVLKDADKQYEAGETILLSRYRSGRRGDSFLLLGRQGEDRKLRWDNDHELTDVSCRYIENAPGQDVAARDRLEYYLRFLEATDTLVANDAFAEFANASYEDVADVTRKLPLDTLRGWVTNPKTLPVRIGLYGMLLGLHGQREDAKLLEDRVLRSSDEFPLGVDGLTAGYLLLTGPAGLDAIADAKFCRDARQEEMYCALQAVRFMRQYVSDRIDREKLHQSVHRLLDRPDAAETTVTDLARWKDWTVMDRLMQMCAEPDQERHLKLAIVRYLFACSLDRPKLLDPANTELPAHVVQSRKHLAALRESDPELVGEAERFFLR